MKDWAIENGATPLHPLVPAAHRPDRREARLARRAGRQRRSGLQLLRLRAGPGRARRLQLPLRRPPGHLRGPRLHRLGRHQPGLPHARREQRHPLHPDGVRVLDRRGARHQDPAAPLGGGAVAAGACASSSIFGTDEGVARVYHHRRAGAGVLPGRPGPLLRAARPAHLRAHPVRRQAAQGPAARGPLLRHHPAARARLHGRIREGALPPRRAGQDPAQRGGAGPVRDRAAVRAEPHRQRPPDAASWRRSSGWHPRYGLQASAAREAVRRRQRLGQAQQLVDVHRHRRQPARPAGRHPHQHAVPGVPGAPTIRAVDIHADLLRASIAVGGQRSPARRQRGPAGDHLDLPGQDALATSWSRSRRACPSAPSGAARSTSAPRRCRSCRATRATATARRRSPSPATSSSSAPWARAPASPGPTPCSTPSWPSRSTTWRPSWRRRSAPSPRRRKLQAVRDRAQAGSSSSTSGSSSTATTTPRSGTRRPSGAGCPTSGTRSRPSRCSRPGRTWTSSRSTAC